MTASTEQFGHIDGVPQGIPIKIQESSANDGTYVPVVAIDGGGGGGGSEVVTGTVTANAGTNLNTSTLALESGGNLAALAGTVSGGKVKVDPSGVTSPVSATSLPLPTNAAQETGGNLATLAGAVSASKVQTTVATALPAGSATIGAVNQGTGGSSAWKVDPSGVTSPVSLALLPALAAGSNDIGNVGGKTVSVTVTPTVTASNAYGTNYVVGGLLTFSNAFTSTGTGILQSVVVTCKKVQASGFTFFPFNGNPSNTTWTDAAVAAINANDVSSVREPISLTANSQLGTHTVAYATGLGQAMAPGSTTLYGVLISNAALTTNFGSTSDITVTIKILQDC